ncbi:hypothetical protein TWF718_005286 [Orbilia javanica]|uniref:Uncharacterized protein n=1 Tax=Orbilia javanica TaxID=47235 RepID=A0AAN8N7D9_9PEZI
MKILRVIPLLLLSAKPSLSQDGIQNNPSNPQNNNLPAFPSYANGGIRKPTHDFVVPLSTWTAWAAENVPKLKKIGDQIDFLGEVRQTLCPIGPPPTDRSQPSIVPPRNSLAFLIRSLRHLVLEFSLVADILRPTPQELLITPEARNREAARAAKAEYLVKEFGIIPFPSYGIRAQTILEGLIHMYKTVRSFYVFYEELDNKLSNPLIPQPIDYNLYRGREEEAQVHREPVILDWATATLVGRGDPYGGDRRITADVVTHRKRLVGLAKYLIAMREASEAISGFRTLTREMETYHQGYTKLLQPGIEFDPDFDERTSRNNEFDVEDLLNAFEAWFGCWQTPFFELLNSILGIGLFPGVEGGLVYHLNEKPLAIEDNGYATELLRQALSGGVISRTYPSVGEGNDPTPVDTAVEALVREAGVELLENYDFENDVQTFIPRVEINEDQQRDQIVEEVGMGNPGMEIISEPEIPNTEAQMREIFGGDMIEEEPLDPDFSANVEIYIPSDDLFEEQERGMELEPQSGN